MFSVTMRLAGRTLAESKRGFFDRERVLRALDRPVRTALGKAGGYVRQVARNSIKESRYKVSELSPEEKERYKASVELAKKRGEPKPKPPRRKASSKPGQPPLDQTGLLRGHRGSHAGIVYVYDDASKSVAIGPIKLNTPSQAPEILEFGGSTVVKRRRYGREEKRRVRIAARPYMAPALEAALAANKIEPEFRHLIGGT